MYSVARDTTDLEVDTGELVPLQGRVLVAAMDTGTPGVVGMRWTAQEQNPQEGVGEDLMPFGKEIGLPVAEAGVDGESHLPVWSETLQQQFVSSWESWQPLIDSVSFSPILQYIPEHKCR